MKRLLGNGSVLFSLSQGFSSLSNLLIGLALSRNMPIATFGQVSLVLTFVYFLVSLQRSAIGDASLIFSPKNEGISRAAVSLTLINAVTVIGLMTLIHILLPSLYPAYLPFVAGTLVAQDGLRYGLVAVKRRLALSVGDILWVSNSGLVMILIGVAGFPLDQAFSIWVLLACGICLFLWLQFRSSSSKRISLAGFGRITSKVSGWAALQFILGNGSVQVALTLFALVVGTTSFAGFRATQMVLSPLIVGTLALASPLLSFVVARGEDGWSKGKAFLSSGVLAVAVGALGAFVVWQGPWLIELLPGAQYVEYSNLLMPGAVALVFVAANVPLATSLLSLIRGRAFFLASLGATVPTSALIVWAAFVGGTELAAWAMALQYAVVAISCAVTLVLTDVKARSGSDV